MGLLSLQLSKFVCIPAWACSGDIRKLLQGVGASSFRVLNTDRCNQLDNQGRCRRSRATEVHPEASKGSRAHTLEALITAPPNLFFVALLATNLCNAQTPGICNVIAVQPFASNS
jgi:hypothetical protein